MTPTMLPTFLLVEGDDVLIGQDGQVTTRRRTDGGIVASAPVGGELAGGWSIDGAQVSREGRLVATLSGPPQAVAVGDDALWVSVADGLYRIRAGEAPKQVGREPPRALAPVPGGVVRAGRAGFTRLDAEGRRTCAGSVRVDAMVAGPAGELVVVSGKGLSVWDAACVRIGGVALDGVAVGFDPAGLLLVVGTDAAIHELAWPTLTEVRRTPTGVDASWSFAEGPMLLKGDTRYDPQTGTFSTVARTPLPDAAPLEALRMPDRGPVRLQYLGPRYAVHAAAGPAQVFEVATLRTVGVPLTPWFEQLSLSPDGRLLVGITQGEAAAYEVASGRRLWAVPVARDDRVEVFADVVVIVGERARRLLDPRDGTERWSVNEEAAKPRRREDALVIRAGTVVWRSDRGGPLPAWTGAPAHLAEPQLGERIGGE